MDAATLAPYARPDDEAAVLAALRQIRRRAGLPLQLGGLFRDGAVKLNRHIGVGNKELHGLPIRPGLGLGGLAHLRATPVAVTDYQRSTEITDDYIRPVTAEGIRSMVAVRIVTNGRSRGLLYGALRESVQIGDEIIAMMETEARRLAVELTIRDHVDRRVELIWQVRQHPEAGRLDSQTLVALREAQAELRGIARAVTDEGLRQRIESVSEALLDLNRGGSAPAAPRLTRRERDVLVEAALGCSNAEIAARLALGAETIKSYLGSAMRKLGVNTRRAAVLEAQRHGLIL